MPMLDVYIPDGALDRHAEEHLIARLTDLLLAEEGVDPSNQRGRALAWVFLHRPAEVWVGGKPSTRPHYKVIASVPEGQYTRERRERMIAGVTEAIADAEPSGREDLNERVWVFAAQIPEGTCGARGTIYGLADIAGHVLDDDELGRSYAPRALATVRAERENLIPPETIPFAALPYAAAPNDGDAKKDE